MDVNQYGKSVNAINYPEIESLNDDNGDLDMVGVNLRGRQSKPRTAAQSQLRRDTGFQ
jgi:hypothetical protein